MKKLTSIVVATLLLSQPLFAAGGYSSGTSLASTNKSKDPFAAVYQLIEAKKICCMKWLSMQQTWQFVASVKCS